MSKNNDNFLSESMDLTIKYMEMTEHWSKIQHVYHQWTCLLAFLSHCPVDQELMDHLMKSILDEVYRSLKKEMEGK